MVVKKLRTRTFKSTDNLILSGVEFEFNVKHLMAAIRVILTAPKKIFKAWSWQFYHLGLYKLDSITKNNYLTRVKQSNKKIKINITIKTATSHISLWYLLSKLLIDLLQVSFTAE